MLDQPDRYVLVILVEKMAANLQEHQTSVEKLPRARLSHSGKPRACALREG